MNHPLKTEDERLSDLQIEKQNRQLERERDDLIAALQHPYVLRVLWRILTRYCRLYSISFNNTGWTNFFEGQRQVGLMLMAELDAAVPGIMAKMAAMNIDAKDVEDLSIEKQGESDD